MELLSQTMDIGFGIAVLTVVVGLVTWEVIKWACVFVHSLFTKD